MSKAVQDQVNKLFEAVKDLKSLEEIKPHCEAFNNWLAENTSYSVTSLGTVLSRVGFYKKFKSIPLQQGLNADLVQKQDSSQELKHYAVLLCGLKDEDWLERNQTTRVSDRLSATDEDGNSGIEIDPHEYTQITEKLLTSDNPHELAVGLIAATGRRPHEILARGKFTSVEGESYQVMFEGQGKKRGDKPVFKISTLFPASYIIERLAHLRKDTSIKELLKQVSNEFPDNVSAQNKAIEDKRGNSLRRVVQEYFGGKDSKEPLLNFRHGQEQNDCKALRAACACLVTERDCVGSTGAKMLFAAKFLGHVTPGEKPSDRDLQHIVTTLGYSDYYVIKEVGFPTMPEKEKVGNAKASQRDLDFINTLKKDLNLINQQAAVAILVERYKNSESTVKELQKAQQEIALLNKQIEESQLTDVATFKQRIEQLEAENSQLKQQLSQQENKAMEVTQQPVIDMEVIAKLIDERIAAALGQQKQTTQVETIASSPVEDKKDINWEHLSNDELWVSKNNGVAAEKVRRSFLAICDYNSNIAVENSERIAITNLALRDLAGVNGQVVSAWMEQHRDEIISHNSQFGFKMGTKSNPNSLDCYANKGKDIESLLKVVSEKFLDGWGMGLKKSSETELKAE